MDSLNRFVEQCYISENVISYAIKKAKNPQLEEFMKKSAFLFKNLGDNIFLENVSEGGRTFFTHNEFNVNIPHWIEKNSFHADNKHFNYYKITVNLHQKAIREISDILEKQDLSDTLKLILNRGIDELQKNIHNVSAE